MNIIEFYVKKNKIVNIIGFQLRITQIATKINTMRESTKIMEVIEFNFGQLL